MNKVQKISYVRILRFIIVGTCNALISFGLLNFSFYVLGQNKIISSLIGTSCALIFSFILNRSYVFNAKTDSARRQILPFTLVTISGSLILLNIIYYIFVTLLSGHGARLTELLNSSTGLHLEQSFIDINLSTAIGAIFALVWNYNGYRLFVFKSNNEAFNNEE
jgi:putative flippase GtrA